MKAIKLKSEVYKNCEVIGIYEAWKANLGWKSKNIQGTIENLKKLKEQGYTVVQLEVKNVVNVHYSYPDFSIDELLNEN